VGLLSAVLLIVAVGRLLSAREVAERLGVSQLTVRRYAYSGRLRSVRLGPKLLRFDEADVRKFVREGRIMTPKEADPDAAPGRAEATDGDDVGSTAA
jgi:excisionase family DNA binding protein